MGREGVSFYQKDIYSKKKNRRKVKREMYIEKWKDTAFGTDYGNDFLNFLESIESDVLRLDLIYEVSNLQKIFEKNKTDIDVQLYQHNFEQFIHYEEAIIALVAVVIECYFNGSANMSKAYGNKVLRFNISKQESFFIEKKLRYIYENYQDFNLFEMLDEVTTPMVLSDISEMLEKLTIILKEK